MELKIHQFSNDNNRKINIKKTGFDYEFGLCKKHLELFGVWPDEKNNKIYKNLGLIQALIIFIFLELPRIAAIFLLKNTADIDILIQILSTHFPILMSTAKFLVMWLKRKEFSEIIKFIKKNWQIELPDEEYKVMMNFAKYSHFISIGSIALGWSASISGLIVQIWYNTESHLMENLDSRLSTNLLWVIYLPWSTKNFTNYSLTFLLQLYTSVLVAVMYNLFNSFVAILVLHFCGQICCIKIMLNFCIETPNNFFVNIKNIAKRHIKLIQITIQLNESLMMIILLELMACTATMCFQNYSTMNMVFEGKNNHVFQILFSTTCQLMVLGNLYLYCWTGHQLTLCSTQIGDAIYESNWTSLKSVEIKLLNIIAFKKFTPLKISAGGFFDMSLDLFLLVIKTSLSYLSVLLAMKKRK